MLLHLCVLFINLSWCWQNIVFLIFLILLLMVLACRWSMALYSSFWLSMHCELLSDQGRVLMFYACSFFTLLEPPGFGDFRKKNSRFRLPYQRPSSSAHCARELFSGSNGLASLVDCTQKNFLLGGCGFFVSDVISGGFFGHLGPLCLALGANR